MYLGANALFTPEFVHQRSLSGNNQSSRAISTRSKTSI
jgi:hypothetical protein